MARGQNNRSNSNNSSRSNSSRGRNNNPEGRNQYSGGMMDMAREQPIKAALGAAAAVGAGVFLWSRRNQLSEQLSSLGEQIGEWRDSMGSSDDFSSESGEGFMAQPAGRSRGRSQTEIAEEALTLKETGASTNARNRSSTTA